MQGPLQNMNKENIFTPNTSTFLQTTAENIVCKNVYLFRAKTVSLIISVVVPASY
jgi:hypothetical protein